MKICFTFIKKKTGMLAARPSVVPIVQNHKLIDNSSPLLADSEASMYRRLVGCLFHMIYMSYFNSCLLLVLIICKLSIEF